jgi:hypothetical protein
MDIIRTEVLTSVQVIIEKHKVISAITEETTLFAQKIRDTQITEVPIEAIIEVM